MKNLLLKYSYFFKINALKRNIIAINDKNKSGRKGPVKNVNGNK